MDALVFAANIMYVATYFTGSVLRLRLLTLCAGCCLTVYFYGQPHPMPTVVAWNLFFVGLNLIQLGRLLASRRGWRWSVRP